MEKREFTGRHRRSTVTETGSLFLTRRAGGIKLGSMRNKLFALTLIVGILFTTAFTQQQPKPQQWEYRFTKECDEKKANSLAVEGWELTEMSTANYGSLGVVTCVFK